jgi:hypothetical protein
MKSILVSPSGMAPWEDSRKFGHSWSCPGASRSGFRRFSVNARCGSSCPVKDADSRDLLGLIARSDLIKPSLSLFDEEHHYEQVNQTPFSGLRQAFRRR